MEAWICVCRYGHVQMTSEERGDVNSDIAREVALFLYIVYIGER